MFGPLFCHLIFVACCLAGLVRPHIALLGYFGFAIWGPQYLWKWTMPNPLEFQKYLAAATLLGFVLSGFRGNRPTGTRLLACGGLLVFLLLSFLSMQQSINPVHSDWFMTHMWKIVLMALVGTLLLNSVGKIYALFWVCVLAQAHNAYEVNMEYFHYGWSLSALNGWGAWDNNVYSILTIPIMAMSLSLTFCARRLWEQLLAGAVFLLQAHQLMLLESRGTMIGGLFTTMLFVYFVPKTPKTTTLIVVSAVLVAALAGPPVVNEFMSSFAEEGQRDSSAESRFKLWKAGMALTAEHPLLGVGPDCGRYQVYLHYDGEVPVDKALHNLTFDITCGMGVPAFLGYAMFMLFPIWGIWSIWRKQRQSLSPEGQTVCLAILCGIPGYWLASMFSSGVLLESAYMLAVAAVAFQCVQQRQSATRLGWAAWHNCNDLGQAEEGA